MQNTKYFVKVLNDAGEWELLDLRVFVTFAQAEKFAQQLVAKYSYDSYDIVAV